MNHSIYVMLQRYDAWLKRRVLWGAIATLGLFYIALVIWLPLRSPSIRGDKGQAFNTLLQTAWSHYAAQHPGWRGNVSLYIHSPQTGAYVATTATVDPYQRHFRAGSTTKTFTAAAVMLLHQEGALNIDERMIHYMPNYTIPNSKHITLRQLLAHRAAVWDIPNEVDTPDGLSYTRAILARAPRHQFTADEFVAYLCATNKTYNDSDVFHYSNTGYAILGAVIERVSGRRFDDFVRERFLVPLQLNETTLPCRSDDLTPPAPYDEGHMWRLNTSVRIDELNVSEHVAEGNIVTVMRDLAKWLVSLLNEHTALIGGTLKQMLTTRPIDANSVVEYGLGIMYVPGLGYGHTGTIDGYVTRAFYSPIDRVIVVLYATAYDHDDAYDAFISSLCFSAKRLLLE